MASFTFSPNPGGPVALDVEVQAGTRRSYRRVFTLALPLGASVNAVELRTETLALAGTFTARDFDARANGTNLHASLSGSNPVLVTLDGRWAVHRLEVQSTVVGPLALHRLDGDTAASDATVSVAPNAGVAQLPTSGNAEFFDVRFALKASSGLSVGAVNRISVRAYPTGARLGLAAPESPETAEFFWQAPGETRGAAAFDVGPELAAALQRHIAARFDGAADGVLSGTLNVLLIAESDTPCSVALSACTGQYTKAVGGFTDGGPEKRVLRFSKTHGFRHELSVSVPAHASVARAEIGILPSFQHGLLDGQNATAVNLLPSETAGAYLDSERWVARLIVPESGAALLGLTLPIAAIRAGTELYAELHTEAGGQPSGQVVSAARLGAPAAGQRGWVAWVFEKPVVAPAAGIWLALTATRGAAVWLGGAGTGSALVLERAPAPGPFRLSRQLLDHDLRYQLVFSSDASSHSRTAPLAILVGETPVPLAHAETSANLVVDLTAGVQAYLASLPAPPASVAIPIVFAGAFPGIVTVCPPEVSLE
jgi:hypothetical protein